MSNNRYRGVSFHKRHNKWRVKLKVDGRHCHLGYYTDEETAARVYDVAATLVWGPAAYWNFDGQPPAMIPRAMIRKRLIELGLLD